ncbi:equilibrative nucleotide transporter 3-like [Panicum miliaceum]|uniref:Equilibrative nucleotide transporter 3-like n=1 Tax=Panicum miliaceum TaxID=4540 RepID=A0A3L6PLU6_PANMI|nr:equilibrative nucleotide transporter 3-like [Panicum miliaceum]
MAVNYSVEPSNMAYKEEDPRVGTTKGKYWGIFICWLLGNGCLFGFNSMLIILDYYMYLFPAKINTRLRILAGYMLFFMSSLAVIVLDIATSGRGGIAPFVGTSIIAATFGVANGHVQGGMTGDLSFMRPEFIQSFFAGVAASGAITSALRFITKAAFENSQDGLRRGAMLFFSISCFFELLCLVLYAFIFPTLSIVIFYRSKAASNGSLTVKADLAAGGIKSPQNSYGPEQNALGNVLVLSLLGGIFFGAVMDWLWLIGTGW